MAKPCVRIGCNAVINDGHFCCGRCWRKLPANLRAGLVTAYRLYLGDPNQITELFGAQQKCIDWWRRHPEWLLRP
jgi:hypothetical protein